MVHKSLQSPLLTQCSLRGLLFLSSSERLMSVHACMNKGFSPTRCLINWGMILFTNPIKCHLRDGHVVAVPARHLGADGQAMPPRCRNYIFLMGRGHGPKWPSLDSLGASPSRATVSTWQIRIHYTWTRSKGKKDVSGAVHSEKDSNMVNSIAVQKSFLFFFSKFRMEQLIPL